MHFKSWQKYKNMITQIFKYGNKKKNVNKYQTNC